jgi:hypothetical protein
VLDLAQGQQSLSVKISQSFCHETSKERLGFALRLWAPPDLNRVCERFRSQNQALGAFQE